jgi:hypothetical protein
MSRREDLLRLTPEALAQAANVGLVKRASKELAAGYRPRLEFDEAATLTARFSDGIVATWEAGKTIQQARCTCGSASVCRHRIMAALAYGEESAEAPAPLGSPAEADEATLSRLLSPRALSLAQALLAEGLVVDVRQVGNGEPCPTARLPMATVRFWGGAALEAARCDCVQGSACEHVALAVWAFRKAGAQPTLQVKLGEASRIDIDDAPYRRVVESLLRHGVRAGLSPHRQALALAHEAVAQSGAVWLGLLLADLENWLGAYAARSARYEAKDGVGLLAELALRLAAGRQAGQAKAAWGVGEAAEVELDKLRLMSLGCRIERDGDQRRARLVLADVDTGTRFVLSHAWAVAANTQDEAELANTQRLAPSVRLGALASGQLLSQHAKRRADGSLLIAKARSNQNSLLPQSGDWSNLKPPLCFERLVDVRQEKHAHPLPQTGPRHAAPAFAAVRIAKLETLFYDPNEQSLIGLIHDADGEIIILKRSHQGHVRHALDAIAAALSGQFGAPSHVAGVLSFERGQVFLEPWAFACKRVVVPDLEPACGALGQIPVGYAGADQSAGISRVLEELQTQLAGLLHQGMVELGGAWFERCSALSQQLRSLSLHVLAQTLEALAKEARIAAANPQGTRVLPLLLKLAGLLVLHREASALL